MAEMLTPHTMDRKSAFWFPVLRLGGYLIILRAVCFVLNAFCLFCVFAFLFDPVCFSRTSLPPNQFPSISFLEGVERAFAMEDRRARLVVLILRNQQVVERRQRRKDRPVNPDREVRLGRRDDLDLSLGLSMLDHLLLKTSVDTRVHRGPARQDDVPVQVLTEVNVVVHDRVVARLVDAVRLHAQERRLEERLTAPEPLVPDRDLPVRKLVRLLIVRWCTDKILHLLVETLRDKTELLFDVTDNLVLSRRRGREPAHHQDFYQVVRQVTPRKAHPQDHVLEREALVDGDGVRETVAGFKDDSRRTTQREQLQDSLYRE